MPFLILRLCHSGVCIQPFQALTFPCSIWVFGLRSGCRQTAGIEDKINFNEEFVLRRISLHIDKLKCFIERRMSVFHILRILNISDNSNFIQMFTRNCLSTTNSCFYRTKCENLMTLFWFLLTSLHTLPSENSLVRLHIMGKTRKSKTKGNYIIISWIG